LWIFLVGVKS